MKHLLSTTVLTTLVALALPAHAQMINLGPSSGLQSQPCDEASTRGGQVSLNCIVPGKGTATFDSVDSGTYTIGTMNAAFGPTENVTNTALLGNATQTFTYKSASNYSTGTLTWNALTLNNELLGFYSLTVVTGTPGFVAAFPVDGKTTFSAELSLGYPPSGKSGLVSYSSGDIMGNAKDCHTVTTVVCD